MMFTIAAFIILLGIMFDEGTTAVMFFKGWNALESNPIYVHFGLAGAIGFNIIAYLAILSGLNFMIKTNRKAIIDRYSYRKIYDISIYLFCFMIVSLATNKIAIGYGHINMMIDYKESPEYKQQLDHVISYIEELKVSEPQQYVSQMNETYDETMLIGYWRAMFNAVMAFLLFKVGNKTVPWDLA